MGIYNGNQLAKENLLEIAKLCANAVLKAPQITGRLKIEMQIVTGEDLVPIIDALFVLGRIALFNLVSYMCWKTLYDEGREPVLLLIGTNLRKSELNWNCGACGFSTCAEFNRYSDKVPPIPRYFIQGPTCHWKMIDYAIACDWACAAAWQYNVTNRIEVASGMAAISVGFLENCNIAMGLPIGPTEDLFWYNRPVFNNLVTHDLFINRYLQDFSVIFSTFPGDGRPELKSSDRWWEAPKHKKVMEVDPQEFKKLKEEVFNDIEEIKRNRLQKLKELQK